MSTRWCVVLVKHQAEASPLCAQLDQVLLWPSNCVRMLQVNGAVAPSTINLIARCNTLRWLELQINENAAVLEALTRWLTMTGLQLTTLCISYRGVYHQDWRRLLEAVPSWLLSPSTSLVELVLFACSQHRWSSDASYCTAVLDAIVHAVATRAQQGRPCVNVSIFSVCDVERQRALAEQLGVENVVRFAK